MFNRPPAPSAAASLGVVPNIGRWSAPRVGAALAGVVHHRQGAGHKHDRSRENDQQGGFHCHLATSVPEAADRQS